MNAIDRLIDAIGYPSGEVSPEKGAVTLRVDDGEMEVHEADGRIVFSRKLGSFDDAGMARLAGYAAGRISALLFFCRSARTVGVLRIGTCKLYPIIV